MNTPLDLDAIRIRADKASSGPWTAVHGDKHNAYPCVCVKSTGKELLIWDIADDAPTEFPGRDEDADFIANGREDIPALISEVEALRKLLATKDECYKKLTREFELRCANLEKAKEALKQIMERSVGYMNFAKQTAIELGIVWNNPFAAFEAECEAERKALAELEKP